MAQSPYISGTLNVIGARPGNAYGFPNPAFPNVAGYTIRFSTSYEAINKLVLPPPLEADRSKAPEVLLWYFASPEAKSPGGNHVPYQAVMLLAHTEHKGVKGMAGWEFVDGYYGDKTVADVMGPWGVYFGMAKKFADIHFRPTGADKFEIAVNRHGVRLITINVGLADEIDPAILEKLRKDPNAEFSQPFFTVREIPTANFSQYSERSVLCTPGGNINVKRMWNGNRASVEFGHLDAEAFDEFYPLEVTGASAMETDTLVELFTLHKVIDTL